MKSLSIIRQFYNRILFAICLLVFALTVSCGSTGSNVYIPAKQTFVLGDISDKNYKADLENASSKAVTLKIVETSTQELRQEIVLEPRGTVSLDVQSEETVYMVNAEPRKVRIIVRLSKGVEGMRYIETE